MGREKDTAKKFSEYLDSILTGKEVPVDPSLDQELRDALDFAQKMAALGATPSAEFRARLKASLLQKLADREAPKEKTGSFWDVFRRHPAWQGAIAALLVIIVIGIVWRAGLFQPSISEPSPVTTTTTATATATVPAKTTTATATVTATAAATVPSPATPVSVTVTTDKATYRAGETVSIEVDMKNVTGDPLTLEDMPPVLNLMHAETRETVYTFTAGSEVRTLAPNEVVKFAYSWNQIDFSGQPVTGSYYIELEDLDYQGSPVRLDLDWPVSFEILPAPTG